MLQIRQANREDFENLMDLYSQLNPDDPLAPAVLKSTFERILSSHSNFIIVAEQSGQLISTCYLNIIDNLTRSAKPYAIIENVVTDHNFKRTGSGREVIRHAVNLAFESGCYKVMLMSGRKDPGVQKFYRSCGFDADSKQAYVVRSD